MEASQVFESPQVAVSSPDGAYIASLTQQNLYIQYASSLAPAFTFPLEPSSFAKTPLTQLTIQWSGSSTHLMLLSSQGVRVFSLNDPALNIQVSNGSGSLGKIHAAEIVGDEGREQLLIVWEFGRVSVWDLSTGRATEVGDVKMTGIGSPWAIRRLPSRTEILVLLMRQGAQDVLSFYLATNPAPYRTVTMPTIDAMSISWSTCGQWLSVLDSSLNSQQVHVYTAEGYPFRQYSTKGQPTPPTTPSTEMSEPALGPTSVVWSTDRLLLVERQTISMLDKRTFSNKGKIDLGRMHSESTGLEDAVTAYQETIDAARQRSYTMLTGQSIPVPNPKTAITELKPNCTGALAICQDEAFPTALYVLDLRARRVKTIALQHATIRRASWHPARASLLMILGEGGLLHLWDVESGQPPIHVQHTLPSNAGRLEASWIHQSTTSDDQPSTGPQRLAILLATKKAGYQVIWPEGRPELAADIIESAMDDVEEEGDVSQDSLYDILSGRTPLPELKVQQVEAEVEAEPTEKLDDTFREKVQAKVSVDIADDSEIF